MYRWSRVGSPMIKDRLPCPPSPIWSKQQARHLDEPSGPARGQVEEYRLDSVAKRLWELLGQDVIKADDCIGPEARGRSFGPGEVCLLENLRHPEKRRMTRFGCGQPGDLYVNDAFGLPIEPMSTVGVARLVPAAAGLLMEKELKCLGQLLQDPARPFIAVLGGAKVADKIGVIRNLLTRVDALLIGGGMAYTFLKAKGLDVGQSLLDAEHVELAGELLEAAAARGVDLELPEDVVAADRLAEDASRQVVSVSEIPSTWMGLDIGREPGALRRHHCRAKTVGGMTWGSSLHAQGTCRCGACKRWLHVVGGGIRRRRWSRRGLPRRWILSGRAHP